ncbi:hypothetical protein [Elongatibacter sediminis]|uniref:Uncharacterized protein n=1 Tax=Elongatibacter sediminis TaxID=3119006 RepID=A0AAW9RFW1_9GAMM
MGPSRYSRLSGLAGLLLLGCVVSAPVWAQTRISGLDRCLGDGARPFHFDITDLQADFKVMVSEYEVEPDLTIRLVSHPMKADLVLSDGLGGADVAVCRSPTRYRSTTLYVARFVTQPDITIMLNPRAWHADFTLYVDSGIYSAEEAAALFAAFWRKARD